MGDRRRLATILRERPWVVRTCLEAPAFGLSAAFIVVVAGIIGFWPWGLSLIGAWIASGPVILLRSVEEMIISSSDALRRPTRDERARLDPCWRAVTRAAGVNPGHYSLWVQKSLRINAFATAGHTVAVTEAALQKLPKPQLEAVLAHELGHHLGGHSWASLLRYWYSLPAMYLFQFATYLSLALATALGSGSVPMSAAIGAITVGLLVYMFAVVPLVGLLAAVFLLVPFGLLWVRRAQEHQADAIAASIGYGDPLAQMLLSTARSDHANKPAWSSWCRRAGDTHPSNLDRVERLKLLAAPRSTPEPQPLAPDKKATRLLG